MFHVSCFMNIIVSGPQGSGKGTQAELLAKKYKLIHIEMGELLRELAEKKTKLGEKINEIINIKKEIAPDDIIEKTITQYLKKVPDKKNIILDGIPRRKSQIKLIGNIIAKSGRKLDKVIFINIPASASISRISNRYHCADCNAKLILGKDVKSPKSKCSVCGGKIMQRVDDTISGVKKRLAIFNKETMPAIKEYKKSGILLEVDGRGGIEDVFTRIIRGLKK